MQGVINGGTTPIIDRQYSRLPVGATQLLSEPDDDSIMRGTTLWTDVATPPTLNLTSLRYKLIISPTNGQSGYHLRTPTVLSVALFRPVSRSPTPITNWSSVALDERARDAAPVSVV